MKRQAGLWAAVLLVLAIGGLASWRRIAGSLTRLSPGATLILAIDADHPYADGLAPAAARSRTLEALRARLDKSAPHALVVADGSDRVTVQLARGDDPAQVARMLTRSGRLEFKIVDDGSEYMRQLAAFVTAHRAELGDVEIGHDGWTEKSSGAPHSDVYLTARERDTLAALLRRADASVPRPTDHVIAFERKTDALDGSPRWRSYYLFARADVDGDRIQDLEVAWDRLSGRPDVSITFDADGAKAFEATTARAVGRKLAIILEGTINSAPVVESKIGGGHARITMGGDTDPEALAAESKELVAALRGGSLAAPVTLVETRAPPAR